MKVVPGRGAPAVCGALAFALAVAFASPAAADMQALNVITANDTSCSMYPQIVSRETGLNAEAGIEVSLLSSDTTIPYVAFLPTGDADLVMLDAAQVLQMANAGQDGSVVYEVYQYAPDVIVVPADSPITNLAELKGKTIGLASDRDQITAIVALLSAGVSIDDVKTVIVGSTGPVMASALGNGEIDAFVGAISDLNALSAAGFEVTNITPSAVLENPGNSFAVWNPRKDEMRPYFEAFLRTWAMSAAAGVLDTKTISSICRDAIPEQWEDMPAGRALMQRAIYLTNLKRTVDYGELQPDVWERVQAPLIELGEIAGPIEASVFLDPSFIEPANSFTAADIKAALAGWREAHPGAMIA